MKLSFKWNNFDSRTNDNDWNNKNEEEKTQNTNILSRCYMHHNECVWFMSIDAQLLMIMVKWKNSICRSKSLCIYIYVVQQTTQTFRCPLHFFQKQKKSTIPSPLLLLLKHFSMYLFIQFPFGIRNMLWMLPCLVE